MENSRFKFRAWDTYDNKMKYKFTIGSITNSDDNLWTCPTIWVEDTGWVNCDTLVIMQYTGLKDVNGVEIYEGDIVAYDLGIDDEKPENYKIIFDNKQCAYFMFPLNNKSRLRHFTYSAKNDCVVIGNIYQNHELLESK